MALAEPTAAIAVAQKAASAATYAGGSAAVYGGLTANEIAAFGGLAIGVIGYLTNLWFKAQHLKLAREQAKPNPEE
jgi:hypothetical protein